MGAVDFYQWAEGETASLAFSAARTQAAWEHGHGGYSGSLAEKDGYVMIATEPTESAANATADALIDADDERISDKWGPAGCIKAADTGRFLFFGYASS